MNTNETTTARLSDGVAGVTRPEWIRLPRQNERCPITGLSRATLNGLILGPTPVVKSVSLRKRHAIRGVRLINLESLLRFIEAAAQSTQAPHS